MVAGAEALGTVGAEIGEGETDVTERGAAVAVVAVDGAGGPSGGVGTDGELWGVIVVAAAAAAPMQEAARGPWAELARGRRLLAARGGAPTGEPGSKEASVCQAGVGAPGAGGSAGGQAVVGGAAGFLASGEAR